MANRKTFVKVFDDIDDHPAFMMVSTEALGLWVKSLTYCNRNLTDGHFPQRAVGKWHDSDTDAPAQLTEAGRWHLPGHVCGDCPQPAAGFLYVHGYLDVHKSREEVQEQSKARAAAGAAGGKAKAAKQVAKPDAGNAKQTSSRSYPETDTETDNNTTRADALADDGFEAFWAAYPNGRAKQPAAKSWARAIKAATPDAIMAGLLAQLPEWRAHREFPKYVPMASTWLNQQRWTDETTPTLLPDAPTARVTARQCNGTDVHPRHEWVTAHDQHHMCLGVSA